jgi:hypothetical protein
VSAVLKIKNKTFCIPWGGAIFNRYLQVFSISI